MPALVVTFAGIRSSVAVLQDVMKLGKSKSSGRSDAIILRRFPSCDRMDTKLMRAACDPAKQSD